MRRLVSWLKNNKGIAAIEFALIVPVFLFAYLGSNYMASM